MVKPYPLVCLAHKHLGTANSAARSGADPVCEPGCSFIQLAHQQMIVCLKQVHWGRDCPTLTPEERHECQERACLRKRGRQPRGG